MSPQFTIAVPLYNGVGTIAETLDSIFSQQFEDFEVIVLDDG
jgi:glycosyltransferase involved in cell wall biosynthesis